VDFTFMEEIHAMVNLQILDLSNQSPWYPSHPYNHTVATDCGHLDTNTSVIGTQEHAIGNLTGACSGVKPIHIFPRTNDSLFRLPPRLNKIYISHIVDRVIGFPRTRFNTTNNLQFLNLSYNYLDEEWMEPWYGLHELTTLDLSNSFCRFAWISDKAFDDMPNLKSLYLDNNMLTLPRDVFSNQTRMKTLHLNGNRLTRVYARLGHMHSLNDLDLSNNNFTELSPRECEDLDQIASHNSNFTVNLLNNQLSCGCTQQRFMRWILATRVNFANFRKYQCNIENGTLIHLYDANEPFVSHLWYTCNSRTIMYACVGGFLGLMLILGFITSVWYYRHRLKQN
jgi:Leucine-rich repeat (LRR) protein